MCIVSGHHVCRVGSCWMMVLWLLSLVVLFGFSVGFNDWNQHHLIWSDEFDRLDANKWQHEVTAWGGGNNEFQVYTPDRANSYVANGKLYIKPSLLVDSINPQTRERFGENFMQNGVLNLNALYGTCTMAENGGCYRTGAARNIPPIMSARLRSYQRFSFTYGRVVIRAKMPVGDWTWPAIWMLPENWEYGGWPVSGEIDIVESIGNRDLRCSNNQKVGIQKVASTLHWGPRPDANRFWLTSLPKFNENNNYGDNFHTYIFDWSPNGLRFFIDDENNALLDVPYPLISQNPHWRGFWAWGGSHGAWPAGVSNPWARGSNLAPFDKNFHFVLNVAVGGTNGFIPDGCNNRNGDRNAQKPWRTGDSYTDAMSKFYNRRGQWKPTWDSEGDNLAMQIDYIKVYQRN